MPNDEEEKLVLELVNSRFWQYLDNILEGRIENIIAMMERPNYNESYRNVLSGRLVELQAMRKIPINFAEFFKQRKAAGTQEPATAEEIVEKLKSHIPEIP